MVRTEDIEQIHAGHKGNGNPAGNNKVIVKEFGCAGRAESDVRNTEKLGDDSDLKQSQRDLHPIHPATAFGHLLQQAGEQRQQEEG